MNRIKELRKQRDITVKDLADKLGIAQSMLTNYENGGTMPRSAAFWEQLAEFFDVSVGYLMGVTNSIEEGGYISDHARLAFVVLDKKAALETIKKPVEVRINTLETYALLANISQLPDEEIAILLAEVQKTIREKYAGQLTEIRLPSKSK